MSSVRAGSRIVRVSWRTPGSNRQRSTAVACCEKRAKLTPRPSKCAPSGVGRPSSMTIIPVLRLGPCLGPWPVSWPASRPTSGLGFGLRRSGWNDRARRAPGRGRLPNLVKDCPGKLKRANRNGGPARGRRGGSWPAGLRPMRIRLRPFDYEYKDIFMSSESSPGTASPTASVPFAEALAVLRAAAERHACAFWRCWRRASCRSPTSPTSWVSRSRASRAISSFSSNPG